MGGRQVNPYLPHLHTGEEKSEKKERKRKGKK